MKHRSSFFNYLLALLTGGQFGLAWLFLMAADINGEKADFVPRLRAFTVAFAILYVTYVLLVGYNMYQIGTATPDTYLAHKARMTPMWPLLLLAIALLAYPIYLIVKIGSFLRQSRVATPSDGVLVLLFFLYLVSLPMLQNRLNALNEGHT